MHFTINPSSSNQATICFNPSKAYDPKAYCLCPEKTEEPLSQMITNSDKVHSFHLSILSTSSEENNHEHQEE